MKLFESGASSRRALTTLGVLASVLSLVLLIASGCRNDAAPVDDFDFWDDEDLEFEIDDFSWDDAETRFDDEGDQHYKQIGVVALEGANGEKRQVQVDLEIIARDGVNKHVLYVTDLVDGNTRIYTFEPAKTTLSIENDQGLVTIVKNPDGSYRVNNELVPSGKDAVPLLRKSPVYADASAWGFLMVYGLCQSCLQRAAHRNPVNCNDGAQRVSEAPAVCDIFRDLCDCTACDKRGKSDNCKKCL